ncbi:MAG: glycosyltransferase family 4 protein [Planctomycetota bacterium]
MASTAKNPTAVFVAGRAFALAGARLDLMSRLADRGWLVYAVASCDAHADAVTRAGFSFIRIPFERRGFAPRRDASAVMQLACVIQKTKPALVHAFNPKPLLISAAAAATAPTTKVVNTVTGLGTLFSINNAVARLGRTALRLATNRCDATVWQCSEDRTDLMSRGFRFGNESRVIVGTGVNTELFRPKPSTTVRSQHRVLMAGRPLRQKGIVEYADAARRVQAVLPESRFCFAGPTDFTHPDSVDGEWFDRVTNDGTLEYVGEIKDMASQLPDYTLAVLPSYREGTPRFLMEAASCGLPVVTTDAPGCRETVVDSSSGLIAPVADAQRLSEAVIAILQDTEKQRRMGKAGRALALQKFDMRRINGQYLRLYRDLELPLISQPASTI